MGRSIRALALALALCAAACDEAASSSGGAGGDAGSPKPLCDSQVPLIGGFACAVPPSSTAAGTSDDFGHHAIGVPDAADAETPMYVFFKGTLGKPFDPDGGEYPGSTLLVLQEAVDQGRIGLVVAYDSQPAPQDVCGDDLDCFGAARLEVVEGIEAGDPGDVQHVRPPDDVFSRIDALVGHLHAADAARFPAEVDWAAVRLGGGSQGGGHAVFIAKELRSVASACNLAGLGDSNAAFEPAHWITSPNWLTPIASMRAVIHEDDPWFERTTSAWVALGLEPDVHWRTLSGRTTDPHGFVVSDDPAATEARLWACFGD